VPSIQTRFRAATAPLAEVLEAPLSNPSFDTLEQSPYPGGDAAENGAFVGKSSAPLYYGVNTRGRNPAYNQPETASLQQSVEKQVTQEMESYRPKATVSMSRSSLFANNPASPVSTNRVSTFDMSGGRPGASVPRAPVRGAGANPQNLQLTSPGSTSVTLSSGPSIQTPMEFSSNPKPSPASERFGTNVTPALELSEDVSDALEVVSGAPLSTGQVAAGRWAHEGHVSSGESEGSSVSARRVRAYFAKPVTEADLPPGVNVYVAQPYVPDEEEDEKPKPWAGISNPSTVVAQPKLWTETHGPSPDGNHKGHPEPGNNGGLAEQPNTEAGLVILTEGDARNSPSPDPRDFRAGVFTEDRKLQTPLASEVSEPRKPTVSALQASLDEIQTSPVKKDDLQLSRAEERPILVAPTAIRHVNIVRTSSGGEDPGRATTPPPASGTPPLSPSFQRAMLEYQRVKALFGGKKSATAGEGQSNGSKRAASDPGVPDASGEEGGLDKEVFEEVDLTEGGLEKEGKGSDSAKGMVSKWALGMVESLRGVPGVKGLGRGQTEGSTSGGGASALVSEGSGEARNSVQNGWAESKGVGSADEVGPLNPSVDSGDAGSRGLDGGKNGTEISEGGDTSGLRRGQSLAGGSGSRGDAGVAVEKGVSGSGRSDFEGGRDSVGREGSGEGSSRGVERDAGRGSAAVWRENPEGGFGGESGRRSAAGLSERGSFGQGGAVVGSGSSDGEGRDVGTSNVSGMGSFRGAPEIARGEEAGMGSFRGESKINRDESSGSLRGGDNVIRSGDPRSGSFRGGSEVARDEPGGGSFRGAGGGGDGSFFTVERVQLEEGGYVIRRVRHDPIPVPENRTSPEPPRETGLASGMLSEPSARVLEEVNVDGGAVEQQEVEDLVGVQHPVVGVEKAGAERGPDKVDAEGGGEKAEAIRGAEGGNAEALRGVEKVEIEGETGKTDAVGGGGSTEAAGGEKQAEAEVVAPAGAGPSPSEAGSRDGSLDEVTSPVGQRLDSNRGQQRLPEAAAAETVAVATPSETGPLAESAEAPPSEMGAGPSEQRRGPILFTGFPRVQIPGRGDSIIAPPGPSSGRVVSSVRSKRQPEWGSGKISGKLSPPENDQTSQNPHLNPDSNPVSVPALGAESSSAAVAGPSAPGEFKPAPPNPVLTQNEPTFEPKGQQRMPAFQPRIAAPSISPQPGSAFPIPRRPSLDGDLYPFIGYTGEPEPNPNPAPTPNPAPAPNPPALFDQPAIRPPDASTLFPVNQDAAKSPKLSITPPRQRVPWSQQPVSATGAAISMPAVKLEIAPLAKEGRGVNAPSAPTLDRVGNRESASTPGNPPTSVRSRRTHSRTSSQDMSSPSSSGPNSPSHRARRSSLEGAGGFKTGGSAGGAQAPPSRRGAEKGDARKLAEGTWALGGAELARPGISEHTFSMWLDEHAQKKAREQKSGVHSPSVSGQSLREGGQVGEAFPRGEPAIVTGLPPESGESSHPSLAPKLYFRTDSDISARTSEFEGGVSSFAGSEADMESPRSELEKPGPDEPKLPEFQISEKYAVLFGAQKGGAFTPGESSPTKGGVNTPPESSPSRGIPHLGPGSIPLPRGRRPSLSPPTSPSPPKPVAMASVSKEFSFKDSIKGGPPPAAPGSWLWASPGGGTREGSEPPDLNFWPT
jgi:hypothetical protein